MIAQLSKYQIGFFITAVALASLVGINQYHFGMWNQYISLPWLYDIINPELYQNDLLVDQQVNSPTFFLYGLAALAPLFLQNIPLLFFSLYSLTLVYTIYSFYRLASGLFKDKRSGVLAVVLLAFAFPVIGDVSIWDSLLMERTIALPFLLISIYSSYSKKYWLSIILQAIAFNIHPLSAAYIIAATWFGVLIAQGFKKEYFLYGTALLLLVSPALYLRFSSPEEAASSADLAVAWMEVMRLRNGHHTFPSEFPLLIFVKSFLIAITYFVLVLQGGFKVAQKKYLLAFGSHILFMLLLGTVFTELYPIKLIIQLQFYRAYLFLVILTIVLWSGLIITRPKPLYFLLAIAILAQYFYGEWSKTATALLFAPGAWFLLRFYGLKLQSTVLLSTSFLALGFLAFVLRGGLDITQGEQDKDWYAVQDWFEANTDINSLAIVPPAEAGFRVRSKRASYGDWFDGTKAFFSEHYAAYWLDHMKSLGCTDPETLKEDYRTLAKEDFLAIWEKEHGKFSEAYVVSYSDEAIESWDPIFKNRRFAVYQLP
tara:strand:+ start:106277 stop:107899 length:1623 start_codon:yes stop_codon:yes gene_type:complete